MAIHPLIVGGLGPVELLVLGSVVLFLAFIFWLIRRPVNRRIDALEEDVDGRLRELEEQLEDTGDHPDQGDVGG